MQMKIHFCDLCNESVPQVDLDEGRAVLRHGRVICLACEAAMSTAAPPAAEPPGPALEPGPVNSPSPSALAAPPVAVSAPSSQAAPGQAGAPVSLVAVGLAFSAVALLVALGCAAFFFLRFDKRQVELESRTSAQRAEQDARVRQQEAQLAELRSAREEDRAAARAELAALAKTIADQEHARAGASGELSASLARIEGRLDALDALHESSARSDKELAALTQTTASLRADLTQLAERVQASAAAAPAKNPVPAGHAAEKPKEPAGASWQSWVGDLTSQNSGTRWQAVQSLGATGDPAVVPHLAPMLKDADIFVRMASARLLGDLGAIEAIPALIDALEDEEASVREASLVSLRTLSGQNLPFDPLAKDPDRAKRVKAWRDWWEQASKELLGGGKAKPKG